MESKIKLVVERKDDKRKADEYKTRDNVGAFLKDNGINAWVNVKIIDSYFKGLKFRVYSGSSFVQSDDKGFISAEKLLNFSRGVEQRQKQKEERQKQKEERIELENKKQKDTEEKLNLLNSQLAGKGFKIEQSYGKFEVVVSGEQLEKLFNQLMK